MKEYEKLCVFCEHLEFDTSGCYGEYPDPATIQCWENMFSDIDQSDMDVYRKTILQAGSCPKYKRATDK